MARRHPWILRPYAGRPLRIVPWSEVGSPRVFQESHSFRQAAGIMAALSHDDAIAERLPTGTRQSIARFAFRIRLDAIEKEPSLPLGVAAEKRRAKR